MTGSCCNRRRDTPGLIIGLALVAAGILFTLDNLNVVDAGDYFQYWPVVLVAVGVARLVQTQSWVGYAWDLALIVAGLWLIGENIGLISISIWRLWPLVLVLVGASIARRAFAASEEPRVSEEAARTTWAPDAPDVETTAQGTPPPSEATFRHVRVSSSRDPHVPMTAVMGAYERATDTKDFRSANLTAVMGGCSLNLRQADISGEEAVVDVLAVMGGIEIYVPEHWTVESRVLPLMGGFEDKTRPIRDGNTRRLIVKGVVFMGGVEVSN